ncbi:MAG TPA: CPBP family intramembrane glutamic endopeptidase [Thermoleophilia bacterium]|nr:CPBP family intramembrane glutamic endopeptidase [Thermoleophilia bacterium]
MDAKEHSAPLQTTSPLYGLSAEARPGDVPWTAITSLIALFVAVAGVALLVAALGLAGTGPGQDAQGASLSVAISALVSTVIVDSWFVGVAWWNSLRRFALPATSWGFRRLERRSLLLVLVALGVVYFSLVVYTAAYSSLFGPPPEQTVIKDFPHTGAGLALFAVMAIVVAPVFEETFFRGFLFQGLARSWGVLTGAIVSAGVFALAHQQLSVIVPFFVLGLLLAWVFYRSRSLWANVALHASFNGISVLLWTAIGTAPPGHLLLWH